MGPHLETETMRCKSGKHEWTDQVDAERCCDPAWERQGRPLAFGIEDMDQDGRRFVVTGGADVGLRLGSPCAARCRRATVLTRP